MGDPEGLVEWSVYAILVALALPFVKHLDGYSPAFATAFIVLAIFPMITWFVGVRFGMPDWFARIIIWKAWLVLACIAVGFVVLAVSWILATLTA